MSVTVHPRYRLTVAAENDLARVLIDWRARHNLTLAEEARALNGALRDVLLTTVRVERDPARGVDRPRRG